MTQCWRDVVATMKARNDAVALDSARFAGAWTVNVLGERRKVTRWYDDGDGPLWLYRDAGGLLAIVRARTWHDAWSVCEDEILDDADESDIEYAEDGSLPEGTNYRPNGSGSNAWNKTDIYSEDLNGSILEPLTADLMERLSIVVTWESYDHAPEQEGGTV